MFWSIYIMFVCLTFTNRQLLNLFWSSAHVSTINFQQRNERLSKMHHLFFSLRFHVSLFLDLIDIDWFLNLNTIFNFTWNDPLSYFLCLTFARTSNKWNAQWGARSNRTKLTSVVFMEILLFVWNGTNHNNHLSIIIWSSIWFCLLFSESETKAINDKYTWDVFSFGQTRNIPLGFGNSILSFIILVAAWMQTKTKSYWLSVYYLTSISVLVGNRQLLGTKNKIIGESVFGFF